MVKPSTDNAATGPRRSTQATDAAPPTDKRRGVDRPHSFRQHFSRYRWWWFAGLASLYLAAFNGQWHVTPDSALYRGLGQSLAAGQGYVYHGEAHGHAYPGLPRILAASRTWLGDDLRPALMLNLLLAAGGLALIYAMLRRDFPRWVAVVVVVLTAINAQLMQHAGRVLTDVPFFFAVCLTLYAQRRIMDRPHPGQHSVRTTPTRWNLPAHVAWSRVSWTIILAAGIMMAAWLRPAFWVLVAALLLWVAGQVWRGSRRLALGVLIALVSAGAAWMIFDTRAGGHDERKLWRLLQDPGRLWLRLQTYPRDLLREHASEAFFGIQIAPGFNALLAVTIFGGGVALWCRPRRFTLAGQVNRSPSQRFWAGLVAVMLLVTLLFAGTVPRYYLMILPLLALGYVQTVRQLGRYLPHRLRHYVITLLLIFPVITNAVEAGVFVVRQHERPFLAHFEHGYWLPYRAMADAIAQHVPADQRVIAPQHRVVTFWSGRDAINPRRQLRVNPPSDWSSILNNQRVRYVVLPLENYKHEGPQLQQLFAPLVQQLGLSSEADEWMLVRVRPGAARESHLVAEEIVARGTTLISEIE